MVFFVWVILSVLAQKANSWRAPKGAGPLLQTPQYTTSFGFFPAFRREPGRERECHPRPPGAVPTGRSQLRHSGGNCRVVSRLGSLQGTAQGFRDFRQTFMGLDYL
jgi:hypothetical protein